MKVLFWSRSIKMNYEKPREIWYLKKFLLITFRLHSHVNWRPPGIKKDSRSKIAIISKLLAAIISRFKRKSSSFKNHKHCDHVYKKNRRKWDPLLLVYHTVIVGCYIFGNISSFIARSICLFTTIATIWHKYQTFFFAKVVLARMKAEFAI